MMEIKNQVLLRLNQPDRNGIIYPTEVIQRMLDKCGDKPIYGTIMNLGNYGEMDGPSVYDSSHVVSNVRIEQDTVVGDIEILKTRHGEILSKLMEFKHREGDDYGCDYGKYTMCMSGHVDRDSSRVTDGKLISVDFTTDPSSKSQE